MSTSPHEDVPALTLGWRLKMALAHGGVSRDEMADNLGVTPSTLSRWMGDKGAAPSRAYVSQWALSTGVSRAWLERGEGTVGGPGGGGGEPIKTARKASADGAALDALTRAKMDRRRRAGSTERYLAPTGSAA